MNAKEITEEILDRHVDARNSDKLLFFYVMKDYLGWPLKDHHKEDMLDFYNFETFRRSRQYIQNEEGEYQATEEVQVNREELENEYRMDVLKMIDDRGN